MSSHGSLSHGHYGGGGGEVNQQMPCAKAFVGKLIGKRGETMTTIQERTGAKVVIDVSTYIHAYTNTFIPIYILHRFLHIFSTPPPILSSPLIPTLLFPPHPLISSPPSYFPPTHLFPPHCVS